ncbi:MAG: SAM-dependent methyltransferase [Cyanobium sp. NAT70]|nr:SAM-dependent methyltransferase [Cyanobium sp. NAT70]|tara:strand:+ start:589 stop:1260 length:672 start_codon:yes stop_codon:yes gene_type:complete
MTTVQVLQDSQRFKLDESDDELFYSEPRFVHHLDASFRQRLTAIYRERIPPCAVVLDLMSSWVSHLPDDIVYQEVIGHGLNKDELTANPRLDRYWVQNLNTSQSLPLSDECIDATLIVAGWQYLQQPESVASELLRVTRPHGTIIVAFSNRMFAQKAPQIWFDGSDKDHLDYVSTVLTAQGWIQPEFVAEQTRADGVMGLFGGHGDPFFAIVARKPISLMIPH